MHVIGRHQSDRSFLIKLPATSGPMVGREAELAGLHTMVLDQSARIVTVTGPAGTGKSRLVSELARTAVADFAHGGRCLDLGGARHDSADPAAWLAQAIGVPRESLFRHLRDRHFLLCLDGFEESRLAPLIGDLVAACPRLVVVIASAEPIGLFGETLVRLGPLPAAAAAELFADRVEARRPGLALTARDEAVMELCASLDGLPLAIELAAELTAMRGSLPMPPALLDRLEKSSFGQSFLRLTPEDRWFLGRVAESGVEFSRSAVRFLTGLARGEAQERLESLTDKSLLRTAERPDGEIRYRMSGLVRLYLRQRPGDSTEYRAAA